ncbi:MAG: ABC transporter ATP-binding protein [Hyphomicrobiaceae bacterium]
MADAQVTPILSVGHVTKTFGALAAVKDLSFDVAPGEVLGIGGPNGAGKTTLFEVISGLNPATAGTIVFEGRDVTHANPEAICHAGIARTFQLNAGFDTLSVRDTVRLAAYFGRADRATPGLSLGRETEDRADEALAFAGLTARQHQITGKLPVLDRKLLMLASAIATEPRLILMDEPVGGLNAREIDQMMGLVRSLKTRGITVILIEHVMRFLVALSTRVMILHHGEKIYEGSPGGLVRDRTVIDVYLGEGASQRLAAVIGDAAHG